MIHKHENCVGVLSQSVIDSFYAFFAPAKTMVYTIDLYDFLYTNGSKSQFTTIQLGLDESHGELVRIMLPIVIGLLSKRLGLPQSATE